MFTWVVYALCSQRVDEGRAGLGLCGCVLAGLCRSKSEARALTVSK